MRALRILVALASVGAFFALASTALADNPPVSLSNVTYSYDQTMVVGQETSVSNGGTNGKQQVRFTMPHGLTKPMKQKATTCLVAANDTRPARAGEKCGHIKVGTAMTNSGILRSTNRFGMFADTVHQGDSFYLIDGQWRKGKCGNKVWFKFSQPRPKGPVLPNWKVQVVQYFMTTATVKLKLSKSVHASASASCALPGSAASATASANGSGTAAAIGQATARSSAQARSMALHSATQNIATQEETLKASAKADVYVKLQADASAVVSCTSTPPPPQTCQDKSATNYGGALPCVYPPQKCTDTKATNYGGPLPCVYPPPPVASPPSVSVNFVQEIDASNGTTIYTARVCGSVKSVSGHTLSVSFRANYGHFDSPNVPPMTADGTDQLVCNTYTSPTEAGGKDQITIVVLDTTTGLNASNVSNLFDIVTPPGNPS